MANFQPHHPQGVAVDVDYGILDNAANWALYFIPNNLYTRFILPNLQLPPFQHAPLVPTGPSITAWYCGIMIGRFRPWIMGDPSDAVAIAVTIGELMGPDLPDTVKRNQADARTTMRRLLQIAMGFANFPGRNAPEAYPEWYNITPQQYMGLPNDLPFDGTQPTRMGLPDHWPFTLAEGALLTVEQLLQVLYITCTYPTELSSEVSMSIIVHTMLAAIKQGNVTRQFCQKIVRGIQHDLGRTIQLDATAVRLTYQHVMKWVTDDNISTILEHWYDFLPADALRLRLTVEQSAGTGLTILSLIGQAVRTYPDFDWGVVMRSYPAEWAAFTAAVATVGNNPWYGYKKNLGNVSSTKYKSVGWVAVQLLQRVGGQMSLANYKGLPNRVAFMERVEQSIIDFITLKTEHPDGHVQGAPADLLEAITANSRVY